MIDPISNKLYEHVDAEIQNDTAYKSIVNFPEMGTEILPAELVGTILMQNHHEGQPNQPVFVPAGKQQDVKRYKTCSVNTVKAVITIEKHKKPIHEFTRLIEKMIVCIILGYAIHIKGSA